MIEIVTGHIIPATLSLLPREMGSARAVPMLIAIGMQESRFEHRRQIRGPARGFWQFEVTGVEAVLSHPDSAGHARALLDALRYAAVPERIHEALEHNDVLACGFARLLLWTLPEALPGPHDAAEAWRQYLNAWRPGKPRTKTWAAFYGQAWNLAGTLEILA